MTFAEYVATRDALEARMKAASDRLASFPKTGPMGLTGDETRALPDWQAAKREFDSAFAALRELNARHVKRFARELREAQAARRMAMLERAGQ